MPPVSPERVQKRVPNRRRSLIFRIISDDAEWETVYTDEAPWYSYA